MLKEKNEILFRRERSDLEPPFRMLDPTEA